MNKQREEALLLAQEGLQSLKQAILLMLSLAGQEGLSNADLSKGLNLKTSHEGGQKDYLTYSVLGELLKEEKVQKNPDNSVYTLWRPETSTRQ